MNRGFIGIMGIALLMVGCAQMRPAESRPMLGTTEWSSFDGKVMPWNATLPLANTAVKGVVITVHGLGGAASYFWLLH